MRQNTQIAWDEAKDPCGEASGSVCAGITDGPTLGGVPCGACEAGEVRTQGGRSIVACEAGEVRSPGGRSGIEGAGRGSEVPRAAQHNERLPTCSMRGTSAEGEPVVRQNTQIAWVEFKDPCGEASGSVCAGITDGPTLGGMLGSSW